MRRKLQWESLESRQMLTANPVITEFMASNDGVLSDGDGKEPDWIEIYNAGDASVDLAGYRLTDRADDLSKWVFPTVTLQRAEYLVVFASGQDTDDYRDAGGHLHTNFSLKASGEYLALVSPDGRVISQFGSAAADYPPQLTDVSYGLAQQTTVIDGGSEAAYWIPIDGHVDSNWTRNGFDSAANGFSVGTAALGYESHPDGPNSFANEVRTILPPRTHAVYARMEFSLDDASAVTELSLRMKFDNAFVAYLNGVKVAEVNAPGDPKWFSSAINRPRRDSEALEPAGFDLSAHTAALVDGKNVLAIHGLNDLADDSDMLLVPELIAVYVDGLPSVGFMRAASPGAANVNETKLFAGFTSSPQISVPRGFYDGPIDVAITVDTPEAVIRFTTDGTAPTATHGAIYTGPIHVASTTTLRAATFRERFISSDVTTHTYVFLEDVIRQPALPPGLPRTWASSGEAPIAGDYEMDPDVVDDPAYRDDIVEGLRSIPTMSLVMDPEDLFGSDRGIYIHSGLRGGEWRRGTSVEIIEPDGASFHADSGILIHGFSWRFHSNTPKHSFRLEFSDEFGPRKLAYPLFPDAPVDRFDSIVLRAQGGRAWAGLQNPHEAQYIRDAFARDTARDMGKVDGHAAFVHLYLNGLYWGLYHAVERPDAQMGEEYFGGNDKDYDALNRRTTTNEAIDGDLVRYNEMQALADGGLTTPDAYAEMQRYVDVDNLIDIFLIHQYTTNRDGPEVFQSNNQRAIGSRVGDPKFRFFVWDMEYSMWTANENININVDVPTSASHVYTKLRENPEFRMRYADRAHKHLFNGGALTPEAAANRWETRANEIYTAIISESARWGDAKRAQPYTRDVEWQRERNRLLSQYFPQRTNVLIRQLRAAGLYPTVDAPVFRQHGGPVAEGYQLSMTNPEQRGTALFTLDGTDPRLPGGAISPAAVIYDGSPIPVATDTTVKARVFSDRQWSALNEANFVVVGPDSPFHLRITEVNYHPHDANLAPGLGEDDAPSDDFEFVELTNTGQRDVNLSGVQITSGIEFRFSAGVTLGPGQQVLAVRNQTAFQSRYGAGLNVAGQFESGSLSDVGENLELRDSDGRLIDSLRYDMGRNWPRRAGGGGSTLQIVDPRGELTGAENWRSSSFFGGSPGTVETPSEANVVFTEVLPHATSHSSGVIELHNVMNQDVDISHWYVGSSSGDYFTYRFGPSTTIPAGGYHVVTDAEFGFELNWWRGDQVWLIEADANGKPLRFVDRAEFGPAEGGVSVGPGPEPSGRWLPLSEPTFGADNARTRIGDVIVTEVHYAPHDPDGDRRRFKADQFEFVELYNRTDETVDLSGWRLIGGVELTFPLGSSLEPHSLLLAVPFDPSDATASSIFRVTLGFDTSVPLAGPYSNLLADDGDLVRLEKAVASPSQDPEFTPYVYVDEVLYGSLSPWPDGIAGTGDSLSRQASTGFGSFPATWSRRAASPGAVDFVLRHAGDANEDQEFDQADIVSVLQAGKYLTAHPASWPEGDFNGDGLFNQADIVAALQTGDYLTGPYALAAEIVFGRLS